MGPHFALWPLFQTSDLIDRPEDTLTVVGSVSWTRFYQTRKKLQVVKLLSLRQSIGDQLYSDAFHNEVRSVLWLDLTKYFLVFTFCIVMLPLLLKWDTPGLFFFP